LGHEGLTGWLCTAICRFASVVCQREIFVTKLLQNISVFLINVAIANLHIMKREVSRLCHWTRDQGILPFHFQYLPKKGFETHDV
jgi:hypothetical protein